MRPTRFDCPVLILALGWSWGCAGARATEAQETLRIGRVSMSLEKNCVLSVRGARQAGDTAIAVALPYPESCDFVRWPNTNVVHLERYQDAWIALVQSSKRVDPRQRDPRFGCDTRFKAIVVRDDGTAMLSRNSNGGTGCPPIQRDRVDFVTLAAEYVRKDGG